MKVPNSFIENLDIFNIKKINKESLTTLLDYIFNDLSRRVENRNQDKISFETFSLYLQTPIFISNQLFNSFSKEEDDFITKEEFISNMVELYCGEPETKLNLYFKFLDINNDGLINAEDIIIILYQFHFILSDSEPEFIKQIILNSQLFSESKQNVTLQEFVEINQTINSDLFVMFSYYFYKTKPFSNHFLNLYFDTSIKELSYLKLNEDNGLDDTNNNAMKYYISNKLKNYLKIISTKHKDIIYDKKFSMSDNELQSVLIENVKLNFDLQNFDETNLINNLDTSSKSVGNNHFHNSKEIPNKKEIIPHIEYIRNTKKQLTETESTQCEENDLHLINDIININNNGSSKTVNSVLHYSNVHNNDGYINAKMCQLKSHRNFLNILFDVYDSMLLIYNNNCESNYGGNIVQIIDLRYSFIDILPSIIKDGKIYNQVEIGICLCNKKNNKNNVLSNSVILLFEEKSQDYYLFIEKLSSYNLLNIFNHNYELKECIGKGAYGNVFRAINKQTKHEYAAKIILKNKLSVNNIKYIYQEINILKILKNLNHKNVIKPIDFFENAECIFIVFEYIPFGDLKEFLHKNSKNINLSLIKAISTQLVSAIKFLHSIGIVHRDLKLNNIMCSKDENGKIVIKLIDFGFSTIMTRNSISNEIVGTIHYMPPEIINKEEYGMKVDVWSCGVILYYLRYGRFPFDDSRRKISILYQLIRMGRFMFGNVRDDFSKENDFNYKQIILKCLQVDFNKRITIDKLINEKWFD